MRDPNRIFPFIVRVGMAWSKVPDQRFGQLLSNFFHWLSENGYDPFYMEDDEMIQKYEAYIHTICC